MTDLSFSDAEKFLAPTIKAANDIVLVGGQALNFWAEYYKARVKEFASAPAFTSKDIDFFGTAAEAKAAAQALGGVALLPEPFSPSVNSAIVTFTMNGREMSFDFLRMLAGIEKDADIRETALPVETASGLKFNVLHPWLILKSRAANVITLGRRDAHPMRQLRAAVPCFREYLRDLLTAGLEKDFFHFAELLFRYCRYDKRARALYNNFDVDLFDALPPASETPERFRETRLPQMREQLAARRERDARRSHEKQRARIVT